MSRSFILLCLTSALLSAANVSHAGIKKFSGPNFSGEYSCTGNDLKEGAYTATVRLDINYRNSQHHFGAYQFTLEVPGYGTYQGHAASDGNMMAIYFANTDPSTKDYGTGIAKFKKNKQGKWTFKKYYYEPEFKEGNYGFETCTQK